jgi:hypothetical protein
MLKFGERVRSCLPTFPPAPIRGFMVLGYRVSRVLSFFQVIEIGTPPTPHPQASVPPYSGSGGRDTLAGERGGGRVPIPTRGHAMWYSIYIP